MTRRLTLSRETLTELTPDDLSSVAGGAQTHVCLTLVFRLCTTFLTCDPTCLTE